MKRCTIGGVEGSEVFVQGEVEETGMEFKGYVAVAVRGEVGCMLVATSPLDAWEESWSAFEGILGSFRLLKESLELPPALAMKFGREGDGDGQFDRPRAIAIGGEGGSTLLTRETTASRFSTGRVPSSSSAKRAKGLGSFGRQRA